MLYYIIINVKIFKLIKINELIRWIFQIKYRWNQDWLKAIAQQKF